MYTTDTLKKRKKEILPSNILFFVYDLTSAIVLN